MDKNTLVEKAKGYSFLNLPELDVKSVLKDPIKQFEVWFKDAVETDPNAANVMYLGTADKGGTPCVRTVLMKNFDNEGFVFFTNYSSRKGRELNENPKACLLFFWKEQGRQVRIEGEVIKVTGKESEEYFHSRPFESQIAALASNQSKVITDRRTLDEKYAALMEKYKDAEEVPCPEHWGGFKVIPSLIEFWQGQENRMHDRVLYTLTETKWRIERLSP